MRCAVFALCFVNMLSAGSNMVAAEPAEDADEPVGLTTDEQCPEHLSLPIKGYNQAVALRTNSKSVTQFKWPTYFISGATDPEPAHTIWLTYREINGDGNLGRSYCFSVADGNIVPMFGDLYLLHDGSGAVQMRRVTENIPAKLRPAQRLRQLHALSWIDRCFAAYLGMTMARRVRSQ